MEFKDRLQKTMTATGISARELAKNSGVSEASISRYLSGQITPKPDRVKMMAKVLHVSEAYLLDLDSTSEQIPDYLLKVNPDDEIVIHQYISMDKDQRRSVAQFIDFVLSKNKDDSSEVDK